MNEPLGNNDRDVSNTYRAVMYLRVAHVQDASDMAIAMQREACEQIARQYGLHVVREYLDAGRPARLEQQTELRRLLDELEALRDAAFVLTWDYTRLSRNARDLATIMQRFLACGAEVATMTGVELAKRFGNEQQLPVKPGGSTTQPARPGQYPLELLRAAFHGLKARESLVVTAVLPSGEIVHGSVTGMGSLLGIHTRDGQLVEDVQAPWVIQAFVQPQQINE